jgi:hypothetical protein
MKNLIIFIVLIHLSINSMDLNSFQRLNDWKLLQEMPVKVEYQKFMGYPISRSEIILNHSMEKVSETIQDLDNYPKIFDRVSKAIRLDHNVIQIILDMPFPFSGRDYVIEYKIEQLNNQWVFSYSSVIHPDQIFDKRYVRLPNAAGIWILEKVDTNQTKVIYAWNGELLGNFPKFGLEEAWITQGTEVLLWLDESLKKEI